MSKVHFVVNTTMKMSELNNIVVLITHIQE